MKRTPLRKIGPRTKRWLKARKEFLKTAPRNTYGNFPCMICKGTNDVCRSNYPLGIPENEVSVDHIWGRLAGLTDPTNMQTASGYCNILKGSKHPRRPRVDE